MWFSRSGTNRVSRGLSPVVGVILLVALTVILAGLTTVLISDLSVEQTAPQARIDLKVDTADDQIEVEHMGGDTLYSDRTKIVWEVAGTRYTSTPTDSQQALSASETVAVTFDGVTASAGAWTQYDSPGVVDIQPGDRVRVRLYDTQTDKSVTERSVVAGTGGTVTATAHGDDLIWMHDDTAGATDVKMEVHFEIQPGSPTIGNSLNSVEIDVQSVTPDMFSGTGQSDVVTAGVDTDGDGTIDKDIQSDINGWTVSDGGSTLKVEFSGSAYTNPQAGETIILVVDNTDTPTSPGTYDIDIQTSGDGNWQSGTITVS